jgi:hypothetical protein
MHFLIGLGLFVVLLYWWLIGHWFARVLVFLLLAVLGALLSAGNGAAIIAAGVLAWFIASLPIQRIDLSPSDLDCQRPCSCA